MATKNVPAKAKGGAAANWKDRMSKHVVAAVEQEQSVSSGAFISTRHGDLSFGGNPFKNNEIKAVIVDAILENNYYVGAFDSENPSSPDCYAFGRDEKTMGPHPDAPAPQSDKCHDCKWNEFGTADTGKGKACKNTRRIALVPAMPLTEDGLRKDEIAFLKPPVTSVKAYATYVKMLGKVRGLHTAGVVTKITSAKDPKTQFKLSFEVEEDLDPAMINMALDRADAIADEIAFPYPKKNEEENKKPAKKPAKRRF